MRACFRARARVYESVNPSTNLYACLSVCLSLSVYQIITSTKVSKSSVNLICRTSVSYYTLCCQIFFCFSTYLAENTLCKHGVSATCSVVSSTSALTSPRTHSITMVFVLYAQLNWNVCYNYVTIRAVRPERLFFICNTACQGISYVPVFPGQPLFNGI